MTWHTVGGLALATVVASEGPPIIGDVGVGMATAARRGDTDDDGADWRRRRAAVGDLERCLGVVALVPPNSFADDSVDRIVGVPGRCKVTLDETACQVECANNQGT